jgi:hypothetical protein
MAIARHMERAGLRDGSLPYNRKGARVQVDR